MFEIDSILRELSERRKSLSQYAGPFIENSSRTQPKNLLNTKEQILASLQVSPP